MKPEKDQKGFWKGALGFITENWGLKVLAFILAVVQESCEHNKAGVNMLSVIVNAG